MTGQFGISERGKNIKIINETQTETGVLCLICSIHKYTLATETAHVRGRRRGKMSLQCLATRLRDRVRQQSRKVSKDLEGSLAGSSPKLVIRRIIATQQGP